MVVLRGSVVSWRAIGWGLGIGHARVVAGARPTRVTVAVESGFPRLRKDGSFATETTTHAPRQGALEHDSPYLR